MFGLSLNLIKSNQKEIYKTEATLASAPKPAVSIKHCRPKAGPTVAHPLNGDASQAVAAVHQSPSRAKSVDMDIGCVTRQRSHSRNIQQKHTAKQDMHW